MDNLTYILNDVKNTLFLLHIIDNDSIFDVNYFEKDGRFEIVATNLNLSNFDLENIDQLLTSLYQNLFEVTVEKDTIIFSISDKNFSIFIDAEKHDFQNIVDATLTGK